MSESSSAEPLQDLPSTNDELLKPDWYLGDPAHAFRDKVIWKRLGSGHSLVKRDSGDPADEADNACADEDLGDKGSDNRAAAKDVGLQPAVLSVVVVISDSNDHCRLTPCRFWNGPKTWEFQDLKLTFHGECPERSNVFAQDFQQVINNIEWILNEAPVGGSGENFLCPRAGDYGTLRFRHVLFEKISSVDSSSETRTTLVSDGADPFPLANWPVIYEPAAAARDEMVEKKTHRVIPLPAYDIAGDLIPPTRYMKVLPGALVRVNFTLSHWFFDSINSSTKASSAKNTFVADVKSIRILIDAPPRVKTPVKTPQKRKTELRDPYESPSKKMRR